MVAALVVTVYVVVAPLTAARYLPLTDLPFHTAQGSTFRHYWDPDFHFRDQFELRPISRPYVTQYALIAILMLVFPALTAAKISVALLLFVVPAGLGVLFQGARKSPLLGLLGLGLCWGNLTHWGFLNYVAALGLFSMVVGFTLMVLDRPTRGRQAGLALALVALYFTHIFRFPFALAAVLGTAIVMYPATRRLRPLLLPLLPALALLVTWWKIRPPSLGGKLELGFHTERLAHEYASSLTFGFKDAGVKQALVAYFDVAWGVAIVCTVYALVRWWRGAREDGSPVVQRRIRAWDVGVTIVPLGCAAVFFVLFLVMPMWINQWWYVYPREATAATLILCAACPDLPSVPWLRVLLVAVMSAAAIVVSAEVRSHYAEFGPEGEDFDRITRRIPLAPKLFYMIVDHSGSNRTNTPFVHLPAYVQAEKGGWLSWHFAIWDVLPVAYRKDRDAVLAPPTPPRWEWTPSLFKIEMTPFFDWFLVRQKDSPDGLFAKDPTIVRVDHVGHWWLYHREAQP